MVVIVIWLGKKVERVLNAGIYDLSVMLHAVLLYGPGGTTGLHGARKDGPGSGQLREKGTRCGEGGSSLRIESAKIQD
jgi:hypothetical protein